MSHRASYALATAEGTVAAACSALSNLPTKDQIIDIARFTHRGGPACEKVERELLKRILYPGTYHPHEIENTLVIVHQCLFIGSQAFVNFFKERIYAIVALTGHTADSDTSGLQRKAALLYNLLQDDERIEKERNNSNTARDSILITPAEPVRGRNLRTWRDWELTPSRVSSAASDSLPIPKPSPKRGRTNGPTTRRSDKISAVYPIEAPLAHAATKITGELSRTPRASDTLPIAKPSPKRGRTNEPTTRRSDEISAVYPIEAPLAHAATEITGEWSRPPSFADSMEVTSSSASTMSSEVSDLTDSITIVGDHPIAYGGFSLLYRAKLSIGTNQVAVAKKILKSHEISPDRLGKRIHREVGAWAGLRHPNIGMLYGITRETNGSIGLISPFFENGNIEEYLKKSQVKEAQVLQIMLEIALGVEYLHGHGIVHGDIKGSNIMVDEGGHVKLIDFGLSRIIGEKGTTTSGLGVTYAFAAPELLLLDDEGPITKSMSSDVYATAMTFIMSGRTPYHRMGLFKVMELVKKGEVPKRPSPLDESYNYIPDDDLWVLLLCCWSINPDHRPKITTVRERLQKLQSLR